jgi:2,4-dienoyl-CoA reductase-like NADH-dependent reductase (Old Yellow Enzyme family)/thioredoxin reductase
LFSPLSLGRETLRNRIISAPMAYPDITPDGCLTREAAAFYELRAKGGAAVVTISECVVHGETGRSHNINICLDNPNVLAGLAITASAIRRHGAIASAELTHSGKYSGADNLDKSLNKRNVRYGPSACVLDNGSVIQEMPKEMIHMLVEQFGKGAALVKKAGFNMILVHAGHGWLLQQFLSPAHNRRQDEYGGSFENRARITIEILDAVRAAVGPGFPIEIRISAEEYCENGYPFEETIRFAQYVESRVDLIQISTGSHEGSFAKTHQPMFEKRGGLVHYAAEVKKHVSKPVAAIGALAEPEMLEEIIASGKADVVEMGRALLADPYLPLKAMTGREDEIVRCCRCFTCMGERMSTGLRICALNPIIGREYESKFDTPATEKKKVLVAGGGPGGMQAAITAAKRGHEVLLCEKSGRLGGALNCERGIPFKRDLYRFVDTKACEMRKAGVTVRMNTEVTPEYAEKEQADVLVVAVGASPIVPPIPGVDGNNVVLANNLSEPGITLGKRIAVLGGGMVGCEAALHLAGEGHKVTVVEMLPEPAVDCNGRQRPILLDYLRDAKVEIRTGLRGKRVDNDGLVCEDKDGNECSVPADTVVIAVGQRPNRAAVTALHDAAPRVIEIGDCLRPARVTEAVFLGYHAGLDI